jgi:hypothetical protein
MSYLSSIVAEPATSLGKTHHAPLRFAMTGLPFTRIFLLLSSTGNSTSAETPLGKLTDKMKVLLSRQSTLNRPFGVGTCPRANANFPVCGLTRTFFPPGA